MVWEGKRQVTGSGLVGLGDGVTAKEATLTFEGIKGSPDATVRFELRDGRPECVEINVRAKPTGRGIRSADIRMFNVDELTIDVFTELGTVGVRDEQVIVATARSVREARSERRGTVSRAELEKVARIYREYLNDKHGPTAAVRAAGGYTERTAARRVKQAEEAGLLPKTTPGKRRGGGD
ncbi:hypothetical protein ACFWUU_02070 [Kribbella sp. NPDC058693]|uniref:hypothetical protein n=1 Tax=Kribbella sp. NPDC058693 TaxID=3346602 RepID=UPI00364AB444